MFFAHKRHEKKMKNGYQTVEQEHLRAKIKTLKYTVSK